MKGLKKLLALVIAAVVAVTVAAPAYAAQQGGLTGGSITINDAIEGQTYSIYQVMYLESYNAQSNAYAYKANDAWKSWLENQTAYVSIDEQGYVTWKEGASAADFAKAALAHAKDASIQPDETKVAGSETVTFDDLKLGYYLLDSSRGTLCSLDTTNPAVVMQEKNETPTNVKTVEENSTHQYGTENDASVGDTVNFQSTITAQAGAENYVFHDKMSAGLTYGTVTGVTLNGKAVGTSNYKVVTSGLDDGCTFHVVFMQAFCDTLKANDKIVISYNAIVNESAVIGSTGNPNDSWLDYGEKGKESHTPPSETKTYVWDVDVFKYTMDSEDEEALAGATFTLSKNENGNSPINLVGGGDNIYRVATADDTETFTEVTTGATGAFTIEGLDSGTYYLTETAAPAGYNKLSDPITVVIGSDGTTSVDGTSVEQVKVLNNSGNELPSTGGMGTTVLYVVGGVLVAGAVIAHVVRSRRVNGNR